MIFCLLIQHIHQIKAKIILNSNLLSKNAILHDFFCKNQISKIFASILMKKKNFQTEIFQKFYFTTPKLLFSNGFKHQKWKLHEGLTPLPPSLTQQQVFKIGAG